MKWMKWCEIQWLYGHHWSAPCLSHFSTQIFSVALKWLKNTRNKPLKNWKNLDLIACLFFFLTFFIHHKIFPGCFRDYATAFA